MSTNILQNNKNKILYFLIIVSIASFVNTVSKGLVNGCDFQWQPAVLLWEGINHYEKFIINGKGDFLCQNGEYAHFFHVLLYPFTLFSWEIARAIWLIVNIIFIFLIPILICKAMGLSRYKTILLLLIFITCYPSRMTLNYGQQSLFVLFFMLLPFIFNNKSSSFLLVFLYKIQYRLYNFFEFSSPKQYKYFFPILNTLSNRVDNLFLFTNSDPITNFFEPIQLSLNKGYLKDADIFSLANIYMQPKEIYIKLLL